MLIVTKKKSKNVKEILNDTFHFQPHSQPNTTEKKIKEPGLWPSTLFFLHRKTCNTPEKSISSWFFFLNTWTKIVSDFMYYSEGFNFCLTVSHGYPLGSQK